MTDIIGRLLDEAEKAQRKGHLLLADVCRDASDQLGLITNERNEALARVEAERDAACMDADMQAREAGNMEHNARVLMAERDRLRRAFLGAIQRENLCPASGGGCLAKRCDCLAEMELLIGEATP
jgi:hypothetical protein